MPYSKFERRLQREKDFFEYMKLLKKGLEEYLIIVTVSDTGPGPLFTKRHFIAMQNALGLKKLAMLQVREPYIAIIDHGKVAFEERYFREKPMILNGKLNNHDFTVYSAGFECRSGHGCKSILQIDKQILKSRDCGFNFIVYDTDNDCVADIYHYETFDEEQNKSPSKPYEYAEQLKSIIQQKISGGGGQFALSHCRLFRRHSSAVAQNKKILCDRHIKTLLLC